MINPELEKARAEATRRFRVAGLDKSQVTVKVSFSGDHLVIHPGSVSVLQLDEMWQKFEAEQGKLPCRITFYKPEPVPKPVTGVRLEACAGSASGAAGTGRVRVSICCNGKPMAWAIAARRSWACSIVRALRSISSLPQPIV